MIVWSRAGILVLVIIVAMLAATGFAVRLIAQDPAYTKSHDWPVALAFCLAAAPLWAVGRWLNRVEVKEVEDPSTGEKSVLRRGGGHTFFFIPFEFWALISPAVGIAWVLK